MAFVTRVGYHACQCRGTPAAGRRRLRLDQDLTPVWDAQTGDVRGAADWSRHVDKSGDSMLECPA